VRVRKDSSCWLEAVWLSNALVDPGSAGFAGCVKPAVFRGSFADTRRPGCSRVVTVDGSGAAGNVSGTDSMDSHGCSGRQDEAWGPFPATFSGGTVIVDFSRAGGPPDLAGFWDRKATGIVWADGNTWRYIGAEQSARQLWRRYRAPESYARQMRHG